LAFIQARETAPEKAQAYFRLGSLYGRLKDFDKAENMFYLGAEREEPSAADYVNWGNNYYGTQKPLRAIELYKKAIEIDPSFAQAYMNLAATFRSYNYPVDSTRVYLQRLLQINPNYVPARQILEQIKDQP